MNAREGFAAVGLVDESAGWRDFVLRYGFGARAKDLAAVVGRHVDEIQRLRSTGACAARDEALSFVQLFTLWNGRPPLDEEWPAPEVGPSGSYDWQLPELALLATQVGQIGVAEIAKLLTQRLKALTGDRGAKRTKAAVQSRIAIIGLQARDVVGGISVAEAGREIGSRPIVQDAIRRGALRPRRAGAVLVIPRDQWQAWKEQRQGPPEGYVQLSTLKPVLSPSTDKLPEYAGLGYIPTAVRCFPMQAGVASSSRGTWFISQAVADQLLADRRAGRPLPWYGKPTPSNLRATWRLLEQRMHPSSCAECSKIWGPAGAPKDFEDYARRYPPLERGAKRHLTRPWTPGMTVPEVARHCCTTATMVRRAIGNGALAAKDAEGVTYVTRTDATRWKARGCPSGEGAKSWIALETAVGIYGFTLRELEALVAAGRLASKPGTEGSMRGKVYVMRQQCSELRAREGFPLSVAAERAGVSIEKMRTLLKGAQWRQQDERVPLETLQTVMKRLESVTGLSVSDAAEELGVDVAWVNARVEDGTIRLTLDQWRSNEPRVTGPMMDRLRSARFRPVVQRLDKHEWCKLSEAATESGVSAATLTKWAEAGEIDRRHQHGCWHYRRASVRDRARMYWEACRFKRAVRPAWLGEG